MGIFDKIKTAIWGDDTDAAPEARSADRRPGNATLSTGIPSEMASAALTPVSPEPEAADRTAEHKPSVQASSKVDVAMKLDAAAAARGQKLDWRHSIVDLMKALGMDASLEERRELAAELNYGGDVHDSAKMNMFLHKALLQKLAENGGDVPKELVD
jgi:hypothetical protein